MQEDFNNKWDDYCKEHKITRDQLDKKASQIRSRKCVSGYAGCQITDISIVD